ncbi:MAG: GNAT family N-acetyltransferase [Spirochaetaceae bacterium]|nr:MAG: GNAT family N-acetyltransferase [Spirochaetaceae bacterium]
MFELSDELVRQIIFAMENQNNCYVIDTELGVLVRVDGLPPEQLPDMDAEELDMECRYQPLPDWTSADGFQLMERFLGELHNPVARNTLQEILLSGKRVFRRFKDTIREYPEVEKRYFRFKYLEMRRVVREWYSRLRELAGLDAQELGADEELDDLVLTEITVTPLVPAADGTSAEALVDLDHRAFVEAYPDLPDPLREHLYERRRRQELKHPAAPEAILYGARNPLEDLCGFLWAQREPIEGEPQLPEEAPHLMVIYQIFVYPEYRGLGIATSLLEQFLHDTREQGAGEQYVLSRLPGREPPLTALMRTLEFRDIGRVYLSAPAATVENAAALTP